MLHRSRLALGVTLALAVTALPATASETADQAAFRSVAASWQEGSLQGAAVGLRVRDTFTESATAEESFFSLQAATLHMETDTSETYLDSPAAFVAPAPFTTRETATFSDAHVQGSDSRVGRFLYAFPSASGSVAVSLGCGSVRASPDGEALAASRVNVSRSAPRADTSRSLAVEPCPGSALTLTGSFLVVLWEWDGLLTAGEASEALWSGKAERPGEPDLRPYVSRARQLYLTVEDGSLTIAGSTTRPVQLFMDGPTLEAASLTLTEATGEIVNGQALSGHRVELTGPLRATLARQDQAVNVHVGQGLQGGSVDGQGFVMAEADGSDGPTAWLWLGLAVVAVPAACWPLLRAPRHRRALRRSTRLRQVEARCCELIAGRRFDEARKLTEKLVVMEPEEPDAHYLHATALGGLGRASNEATCREALAHHTEAARLMAAAVGVMGDRPTEAAALRAENALQAAITAASCWARAEGEERDRMEDLALNWMAEAARAQPDMDDFRLHSELQPLLPAFVALMALHDARAPDWLRP